MDRKQTHTYSYPCNATLIQRHMHTHNRCLILYINLTQIFAMLEEQLLWKLVYIHLQLQRVEVDWVLFDSLSRDRVSDCLLVPQHVHPVDVQAVGYELKRQ